ncbi:hypothetical protein [Paracoccus shandongensis]|uniref:hypothetical protein n=1 Tax=Paracoccus shandongensis TaxID=2816048 RepID=UPI001A8D3258|nr:hypothetical protein [Paracoccus shandongensis]
MKSNRIREIWARSGCALNAFLSIPSPFAAEIMAAQAYDGLIAHLQHGVTDCMTAVGCFRPCMAIRSRPWPDARTADQKRRSGCFCGGVHKSSL